LNAHYSLVISFPETNKFTIMKTKTLLFALTTVSVFAQGPLAPPAAPAPTMKTLDQIEARTAIPASPAIPIAGPHYVISEPGSYYLTGNIKVASGDGIQISSGGVTLDLNGFALISTNVLNPTSGSGIKIFTGDNNIQIKNGSIRGGTERTVVGLPWQANFSKSGWFQGVENLVSTPTQGISISHLTVERCGSAGISLNGSSKIEHVSCISNGGTGISVRNSVITNSIATNNDGDGINAANSSISNSRATGNAGDAFYGDNSCISNVAANGNGSGILASGGSVTDSTSNNNANYGINVNLGVVAHCVASGNTGPKQINVSVGGQRDACVPASE
jgi:hypothetical protein